MRTTPRHYEVVIAGAGPAGLATGLFTARYGLSTLILDGGKSLLRQCAYLDNYLGFPGGIEIPTFLDLARAQAEQAGCVLRRSRVVGVAAAKGRARFRVHTRDGARCDAERLVAASPYDVDYLRPLLDEPALFGADGLPMPPLDAQGRTAVDGLYLTGTLAGVESQALICAGQGARTALALIIDLRQERGFWEAPARHLDWLVPKGRYDRQRWAERVRAHFRDTVPDDHGLAPQQVEARIEEWIRDKQRQQIDPAEAARRGRRWRHVAAEQVADHGPLRAMEDRR